MRTCKLSTALGAVAITAAAPLMISAVSFLAAVWPVVPLVVAFGAWGVTSKRAATVKALIDRK